MDHTRHLGVYNIPSLMAVSIVGAGGIGALAAMTLSKMGVNFLELLDNDKVDTVNLATQLHTVSGVGNYKVDDVAKIIHLFSDEARVLALRQIVDANTQFRTPEIVISAVDSWNARKAIWQAVLHQDKMPHFYIDTRMSAEIFQMAVVNLSSYIAREHYDAAVMSLDENDIPEVVCTEKATFYCADMASGHIGAAIKRIVTGDDRSYQVHHNIAKNVLYEFGI